MTVLCLFLLCCLSGFTKSAEVPALIPMPQKIDWNQQNFKIEGNESRMINRLVAYLPDVPINQEEAYQLKVNADSVILQAITAKGLFRGQQTLRQLTVTEHGKSRIAGCTITDWPAFQCRGFMQDVGRNFMSLPMLKEQIQVMAAYKFNTFHLHLTDNPGWRLESKKYPQLHEPVTMSRWPGKYYTQEDFLELVNYCNERFITLIPEFDIPGHCEAFRKAFSLDSMSDPRVKPILLDLIDELCSLVPDDKMPFIHLGTDEVWVKKEKPAAGLLEALIERVRSHNRQVEVWRPGQTIDSDNSSITQLWSSKGKPKQGHPYFDSRLNYLNHLDPLAGVVQLYFDRIGGAAHGDSLRLGGILCCWNDNKVNDEYDILRQNPVYPGMLTYSETSWKGQPVDLGDRYLAQLPSPESTLFKEFVNFEDRLVRHRDLYFQGKPFPYVRQTPIDWKIIGPFTDQQLESILQKENKETEKTMPVSLIEQASARSIRGGTIHLKHFFGFPSLLIEKQGTVFALTSIWSPKDQQVGCWIGFHDWSRSGGRRGGPFPQQGQWHTTNPQVWVNNEWIAPPVWKNPGLVEKTEEIPFTDENYFFREPTTIHLKKGWNKVLLKVPHNTNSWKWMFTFVPVDLKNEQVREVKGLKFSAH
jgi:hypothetical protein